VTPNPTLVDGDRGPACRDLQLGRGVTSADVEPSLYGILPDTIPGAEPGVPPSILPSRWEALLMGSNGMSALAGQGGARPAPIHPRHQGIHS